MALRLPKLDKALNIVDLTHGRPTAAFQRWWQSATVRAESAADDASGKVSRLNHILYHPTTLSTPPTQVELQTLANAVAAICEKLTE